ncbi:hypothetical protein MLD38_028593 [Melastoma candidum]|uniref:Uncharacterized protein n=1 Tax=Melastoma candidum TaxID=119954 RepID=A0ACB9N1J5_9MYRT|nr:hypothetical protein MLD38_028593 [Melastoma candidum]
MSVKDKSHLWHRRLGHSNFKLLSKLVRNGLVNGLPNIRFEAKTDEGIFLGYSLSSKAYRVLNKRTSTIEESINVKINDAPHIDTTRNVISLEPTESSVKPSSSTKVVDEPSAHESKSDSEHRHDNSEESSHNHRQNDFRALALYQKRHPIDQVIGDINRGIQARRSVDVYYEHSAFLSQKEPESIDEALDDPDWILAMQEELNQFERNKVWSLVPKPDNRSIVGTKWVFRNKHNGFGVIVRNKVLLVAKGYSQEEGIDFVRRLLL